MNNLVAEISRREKQKKNQKNLGGEEKKKIQPDIFRFVLFSLIIIFHYTVLS